MSPQCQPRRARGTLSGAGATFSVAAGRRSAHLVLRVYLKRGRPYPEASLTRNVAFQMLRRARGCIGWCRAPRARLGTSARAAVHGRAHEFIHLGPLRLVEAPALRDTQPDEGCARVACRTACSRRAVARSPNVLLQCTFLLRAPNITTRAEVSCLGRVRVRGCTTKCARPVCRRRVCRPRPGGRRWRRAQACSAPGRWAFSNINTYTVPSKSKEDLRLRLYDRAVHCMQSGACVLSLCCVRSCSPLCPCHTVVCPTVVTKYSQAF